MDGREAGYSEMLTDLLKIAQLTRSANTNKIVLNSKINRVIPQRRLPCSTHWIQAFRKQNLTDSWGHYVQSVRILKQPCWYLSLKRAALCPGEWLAIHCTAACWMPVVNVKLWPPKMFSDIAKCSLGWPSSKMVPRWETPSDTYQSSLFWLKKNSRHLLSSPVNFQNATLLLFT